MKIKCAHTELVDTDLLVPNPRNPNKHPDEQIKLLAKIMKHQGWRSPVVVSKRSGFIVKGHGRLMAAKLNGWTQAPVDRQDYATEADEYADMVADNKIAELSEHDDISIVNSIKELDMVDFDFELMGLKDLSFMNIGIEEIGDKDTYATAQDHSGKFIIEVQFPNDMEMNDIKDDLLSRGYIVKVKNG
jgi:predicted  nucleic acid-binding Zn-ribbon protein